MPLIAVSALLALTVVIVVVASSPTKHRVTAAPTASADLSTPRPTSPPATADTVPVETPNALAAPDAALPNRLLTPGAVAETSTDVVCHRSTRSVRPPESYTERLKREQIVQYGYTDTYLSDYEEDHLIPLELGGDPSSPRNLWPEPHDAIDGVGDWGSQRKDIVENDSHRAVCDGTMSLAHAQTLMASNWIALGRELHDL
jgi:hypothetical protein